MEDKKISFKTLMIRALPEMWFYEIVTSTIMGSIIGPVKSAFRYVATTSDTAITTANIGEIVSWRGIALIPVGLLVVLLLVITEVVAPIFLCEAILKQEPAGIIAELKKAFKSAPKFITPGGILLIIYMLIVVPLSGVGISLSLTDTFKVPDFIQSYIDNSLGLAIAFRVFIAVLIVVSLLYIFTFHGILLDNKKPLQALKASRRMVTGNIKEFLKRFLMYNVILVLIWLFFIVFLHIIPYGILETIGRALPENYVIDFSDGISSIFSMSELDIKVFVFRFVCILENLLVSYLYSITQAMLSSAFILVLTRMYFNFKSNEEESYKQVPRNFRHYMLIVASALVPLIAAGVAFYLDVNYEEYYNVKRSVPIVAHRTGGYLASENSLEGIDEATKNGCYGSETDIQRTADGYYIINHDNDFKRLTGVAKKPGEMTLKEIKELRIEDTTGNGEFHEVPTLEELLDRGKKDGITLFLEFKGESADRQMVDDVIKAVKERGMTDDVVLISLKLDVLEYAEETYPEFETGALIFGSLGDTSKLNCDMIIMEEEMAYGDDVEKIHQNGKKVGVWTVNTYNNLYNFLDADVEAVITDDIHLAKKVEKELSERTDRDIIEDRDMFTDKRNTTEVDF